MSCIGLILLPYGTTREPGRMIAFASFQRATWRISANMAYGSISAKPDKATYVSGKWARGTRAGRYFIVWNNGGSLEQVGSFVIPAGVEGTFAARLTLPEGTYVLGATGQSGGIGVYSGKHIAGSLGDGWSLDLPDDELTRSMTEMRT